MSITLSGIVCVMQNNTTTSLLNSVLYTTQPGIEAVVSDSIARRREERQGLVHIVVVQQHLGQNLPAQVQVVDVGTAVVAARMARAARHL